MNYPPYMDARGVAEDTLIKHFRNEGVFTAPETNATGSKQTVNFERLFAACCSLYLKEHGNPKHLLHFLLTAAIRNIY